ncbi:DMT family transporter [Kiloniella sp. b19]|uniref:DMT family transporter n=1 Tax=Kiloniella sp. GXU_MW_B19 TaxID=3141326 RepID=UPI0031E1E186
MATHAVARPKGQENILLGVACILFATAGMAFTDALIKFFSANLTLWQVFVVRSGFAVPCLIMIARWKGNVLMPESVFWTLVRSVFQVLSWLAFYAALPVLSLSIAAVAVYTSPIITTVFAAIFLREEVSARQWVGVCIGFAGVIVILRPWTGDFNWAVLMPFASAIFYTLTVMVTRRKCQDERATTLTLWSQYTFIAFGVAGVLTVTLAGLDPATAESYPFLLNGWPAMAPQEWALLGSMGLLAALAFLAAARAYQAAPPQIIATIDNCYLIWAAVWGIVFFGDTPGSLTLAGIALIFVAGGLVATRPLGGKNSISRR